MEKGSFHTSPGPTSTADELVKSIALPNQMPKGLDFADISPSAMKSSTLEALISQNEDLMARLSVNLRKTNQLEENCAILTQENSTFRAKFEALREQFLVLKEKDSISSSRQMHLAEETSTAKTQLQRLEKIYAELYVQAQSLQRRLVGLERYRVRVRKAASSIQIRSKRTHTLELETTRLQTDFEQLKKTLSAATTQTVNSYEAKLSEARQTVEEFKAKAEERDAIFETKVRVENQLLFEQRQSQMRSNEAQLEIDRLTVQNSELRVQLKDTLVTNEAQQKQLAARADEWQALSEETQGLRDQVESLQVLWGHKQKEFEQSDEKNRALQKLNQSLSLNLNNQRKELHELKNQMEREQFAAQEKIKTLLAEVQMLRQQMIEGGLDF